MSLLMGALGGAGAGLADVGSNQLKYANEQDMIKQRADLDEQKAQNLALFKQKMVNDERGRVGGIISSARKTGRDALNDAGPNTNDALAQAGDQAAQNALTESGDLDSFKVLHDASNKDEMSDLRAKSAEQMAVLQQQKLQLLAQAGEYRRAALDSRADREDARKIAAQAAADKVDAAQIGQIYGRRVDALTKMMQDPMVQADPKQKAAVEAEYNAYSAKIGATLALRHSADIDAATASGYVESLIKGNLEVRSGKDGAKYINIDGKAVRVPLQLMDSIKTSTPKEQAPSKPGIVRTAQETPSTPEERARMASLFGATDTSRANQVLRTMGPGGTVSRDALGNDLAAYFDRDKPLQASIASTMDSNADKLLVPGQNKFRQY